MMEENKITKKTPEEIADRKFNKFLKTLFSFFELSGYSLESRIVIKDQKTGKIYQ